MLEERFSFGRVMRVMAQKPDHQPLISAMYGCMLVCLLILFGAALILHSHVSHWVEMGHISGAWLFFMPGLLLILVLFALIPNLIAISSCKRTAQLYVRSCFGLFVVGLSFSASLHEWHHAQKPKWTEHSSLFSNTVHSFKSSFAISRDFFIILAKGALDKDHEVRQAAALNIRDRMGIELSPGILGLNQTQSLIQGVVSKNTMEGFLP